MSEQANQESEQTRRSADASMAFAFRTEVKGWDSLSSVTVRNPTPDASPSREPTGVYRIIKIGR